MTKVRSCLSCFSLSCQLHLMSDESESINDYFTFDTLNGINHHGNSTGRQCLKTLNEQAMSSLN